MERGRKPRDSSLFISAARRSGNGGGYRDLRSFFYLLISLSLLLSVLPCCYGSTHRVHDGSKKQMPLSSSLRKFEYLDVESETDTETETKTKRSPLVTFQVTEPVLRPPTEKGEDECVHTTILMEHVFAYSYGHPFVGKYTPPPCSFNRVIINLTVTSQGRQFDRLGLLYLGDIEIFRTSTAEPTKDGIVWTYLKEMHHYLPLWTTEQKIIFDLGNLVNDVYTGTFNTTLTATFFTAGATQEIADMILPISAQRSPAGQGSAFSVPSQPAIIVHELPLNIEKAVVSISACGQDKEEFWYQNVLSSRTDTFESKIGSMDGYSPFREIQLLIDGELAGVVWPFPVVFTGGIAPGLWRPIVGIDAFDLRENQIDITPFIPQLCDGNPHVFQIKMVGLKEDGKDHATLSDTVGSSWVVSGKIFLFLNKDGHRTTGFAYIHDSPEPPIQISSRVTTNSNGANETLVLNTEVTRYLYISHLIATPDGYRESWWQQSLSFSNFNKLSGQGLIQLTNQITTGSDESSSEYETSYTYPLTAHSEFSVDEQELKIHAAVSRNKDVTEQGPSVFPSGYRAVDRSSSRHVPEFFGGHLSTTQNGHANYVSGVHGSYSYGATHQEFSYHGIEADAPAVLYDIYNRRVSAVNLTLTEDQETYLGKELKAAVKLNEAEVPPSFAAGDINVRAVLGRGPGNSKVKLLGLV